MEENNQIEYISNVLKELGDINYYTISPIHKSLVYSISNSIAFLNYHFKNFDSSYSIGLMLTFPELWINFTKEDWIKLVEINFPREEIIEGDFRLINNDGKYRFDFFA